MRRLQLAVLFLVVALAPLAARATIYLHEDFESPLVVTGSIAGQNGWQGATAPNFVTTERAHTGTQCLVSGYATDKEIPGGLPIHSAPYWYMETWVYLTPFNANHWVTFYAGSGLGMAFYIAVSGDGRIQLNSGLTFSERPLGSAVFGKWLRLRLEKTAHLFMELSVTGPGVSETMLGSFNTPWSPNVIGFRHDGGAPFPGGGPYFDDVVFATETIVPVATESWGGVKALYR